jgi:hypothetical protein
MVSFGATFSQNTIFPFGIEIKPKGKDSLYRLKAKQYKLAPAFKGLALSMSL